MKKYLFFALVFISLFFGFSASAATLELSPASGVIGLGDIFTVDILINTQGASTDGVDIHYLNYPKNILEVQDDDPNTAGIQISAGSLYQNTQANQVDALTGKINFSQVAFGGLIFNGSGKLAAVRFKAIANGTANLNFDFVYGLTTDTNIASQGQDVLSSVINRSYTIGSVACTNTGLSTPLVSPTSPQTNQSFTVTCPTNDTGYDCFDVYINTSPCSYSQWQGNNTIFNCNGFAAGNYTAKCQTRTGTSRNCCLTESTTSFTVQSVTPPPTTGNSTIIGGLTLYPTIKNIGVVSSFTNDNNQNNNALLEYREAGGTWKQGIAMTADRRATIISNTSTISNPYRNQWRASILWLNPDKDYEVKVTYTDPDGVSSPNFAQGTIKTRKDVIPLGSGAKYYVAINGSDANSGAETAPFRTIQKAADSVSAGSTVYIRAGIYNEKVTITASGAENNYINFLPYGDGNVIIDGQGSREYGITVGVSGIVGAGEGTRQGGNYVRISGLKIFNSRYAGINVGGDNVYIENNEIRDFNVADAQDADHRTSGITVNNWGTANLVARNNLIVRNIGTAGFDAPMAIHIRNEQASRGGGHVIANNQITTAGQKIKDGIGGLQNFSYTGSFFHDSDIYDNYIEGVYDDAIESEGGNMNVRIWGNTLKNARTMGLGIGSTIIGPVYIFRNIIYGFTDSAIKMGANSTGATYLYHNTIYTQSPANGPTDNAGRGLENVISRNNIYQVGRYVIEIAGGTNAGNSYNYDNLYTTDSGRFVKWYGTLYTTLASFRIGTGQELNGISANSQFVSPASDNFRLQGSSLNIDKGIILVGFNDANSPWPYKGTASDLGAFEYDSGAPPPDTTPPIISNGQPTGTLSVGTTQATISLTTNESATCRYSTAANTAYASLPNVFTNTGGTSHSSVVSGLTNGTSYTYYARCQDAALNANTNDFVISFSVANPSADTTPPIISNIQSSNITQNGATITWTTDDLSNTIVNYGTASSLGQTSTLANSVTSHSVSLTGLNANTIYYYQARSCNSVNLCTNSLTDSFTTQSISTGGGGTIEVRISGGADDAGTDEGTWSLTRSFLDVGNTAKDASGMIFRGINIPKGSVISNAYLAVVGQAYIRGDPRARLYGEDSANPLAYTTLANFNSRALTAAYLDWDPNLTSGVETRVGVTAIIQELVNKYDYANGSMAIRSNTTGSPTNSVYTTWYTYNGSLTAAPKLHIEYSATKFSINDRVVATANLNVRSTPSVTGNLLGVQAAGSLGTVMGGPVYADNYRWWQVNYDNNPDGWSIENWLARATSSSPGFTLTGINQVYFFQDRTNILRIQGNNFNLATNFSVQLLQNSTEKASFTVQPQNSSTLELNLTTSQLNSLGIGFYDLRIVRATDNQAQTHSKQVLITALGDIWSPTAGDLSEQKRDGLVNIYDVARLLSKWGSAESEYDINSGPNNVSQGRIDIYDANLMMKNWKNL